jgi:hypothetical protein
MPRPTEAVSLSTETLGTMRLLVDWLLIAADGDVLPVPGMGDRIHALARILRTQHVCAGCGETGVGSVCYECSPWIELAQRNDWSFQKMWKIRSENAQF